VDNNMEEVIRLLREEQVKYQKVIDELEKEKSYLSDSMDILDTQIYNHKSMQESIQSAIIIISEL